MKDLKQFYVLLLPKMFNSIVSRKYILNISRKEFFDPNIAKQTNLHAFWKMTYDYHGFIAKHIHGFQSLSHTHTHTLSHT